ncbi:MAG TPA: Gfo/Idh/MocA family oxidoreductase [Actinomycetota bacterium]
MSEPIRAGLIGFGYWGPMFVRNFAEIDGVETAWVCDRDPERRAAVAERYPDVAVFESLDDALIAGADAVVVATPPRTHEPLARKALEAGLHVLVEKPIAMTGDEALALGREAERRNLTLMVGHILRYSPALRTIKTMIEDGDLGDLYYLHSTRVNLGRHHRDVNVMWDLGPHDMSAILPLVGQRPEAVSAWGRSFIQQGLEDVAFLYLRFPGGQIAHVHLSWLDPLKVRQIVVVGSKRMLVYDDVATTITLHDKSVDVIPHAETLEEFRLAYHYGETHQVPVAPAEPLAVEIAHFLDCIRHGTPPVSGAAEGFEVVRVLEAAQTSLERGGAEVAIEWPSDR